jgi:DNA-binding XRE family transcriptional regulator
VSVETRVRCDRKGCKRSAPATIHTTGRGAVQSVQAPAGWIVDNAQATHPAWCSRACWEVANDPRPSEGPPFHGEALTEGREAMGLSTQQLAAKSGVTARKITSYEKERTRPTEPIVRALAVALNLPREFFSRKPPARGDAPIFFCSMRGQP